jgi:predicted small lipoprotein YifL
MMKRGKTLLTSLAIILLTLGLSACEQEGPAERAGEKVDAAAERAKEAVDPKGPAERAGEKADEAMERAGEATEERTQ